MFTKKTVFRVFSILLVLLMMSGSASASPLNAPIGTGFTYQGKLTDGGAPANGTYDFSFNLYDALSGGTLVGSLIQGTVPVTNGLFTVQLDFGYVFDGTALYLEIGVRPGASVNAYTALIPRQPLTPAPYSLFSTSTGPHSHFGNYWTGANNWGLFLDNTGTGDGLRAYSRSTELNYAAVYGQNVATTGYGTGVYGASNNGLGVYAYSGTGDGLEATTDSTTRSAIYAHATNSSGVWAVSGSKVGVHGASSTGRGVEGISGTNSHAGYFESTGYSGGFIKTDVPASYYGAIVDGGLHVINGNCVGCALVYLGQNNGAADIEKGDLVAAAGVKVDPDTLQPVLLVRCATSADDTVIGVAVGAAAPPSDVNRSGPAAVGASGIGVVALGEYVQVMISGLVQVKVSGKVVIGNRLVPGNEGAVPTANASSSVVRVMSEPDENGLVWVLIDAR